MWTLGLSNQITLIFDESKGKRKDASDERRAAPRDARKEFLGSATRIFPTYYVLLQMGFISDLAEHSAFPLDHRVDRQIVGAVNSMFSNRWAQCVMATLSQPISLTFWV